MPRGYRSLGFAALVALALVSFGLGAFTIALGYPEQQQRYERNQSSDKNKVGSLTTVADLPSSDVQNTPCKNPQTETERDLCQQWRAANAAEKSAQWAVFGVIASIIGISLLLWQIILTREAVKDTGRATDAMREANEISERIGEAQTRCYLGIKSASVSIGDDGNPSVTIIVVNTGQSPARKFRWTHEACWRCGEPEVEWKSLPLSEPPMEYIRDIPVGESPLPNSVQLPGRNLTQAEEFQLAIAKIIFVKVVIWMLWEDVFGNSFSERWNFQACHMGGCIDKEVILWPDIMAVERP